MEVSGSNPIREARAAMREEGTFANKGYGGIIHHPMTSFNELLQQGATSAWLFIPSAVVLGALHGLEPGHSKTMMAAFIIAVRGTVGQAVLLGLAAAFSHSLVIWALAAVGLRLGNNFNAESFESYFQLASGVIIVATALWMAWRTTRELRAAHAHDHDHAHGHHHAHEGHDHGHRHEDHGTAPHPHGDHDGHEHPHDGDAPLLAADQSRAAADVSVAEYEDAHQRAHARDIETRFANRRVTTGQIVLFGLTGGLVPCPASLTVLLVCLQLKRFALGFTLVLCFSFGLALTLVTTGAVAAWSVHHASRRWAGFGDLSRRLPFLSAAVLALLGLYMGVQGFWHLPR